MAIEQRLKGRLALVTGASRGLGRATAVALAGEGAQVIITGRTQGALEDLDDEIRGQGGAATILTLDLRNGERLDQLGPTIFQRWGKLDILIANAGVLGPLSPLPHVTADAWTSVIETNLSANWRLVRTLDPLLKLSDAGRVVFLSSGAAHRFRAYWGPYSVSKAGLEALAKTYAAECENTAVRVNLVDPGPMRTAMRAKAYPGEDPSAQTDPANVARVIVAMTLPSNQENGRLISFRDLKRNEPAVAQEGAAES